MLTRASHLQRYAEGLYRSILKERPNYIDCFLRLGAIAEVRGNNRDASVWYREALSVSPHNADAYTALAKLHVDNRDLGGGQKKLEKILQVCALRFEGKRKVRDWSRREHARTLAASKEGFGCSRRQMRGGWRGQA